MITAFDSKGNQVPPADILAYLDRHTVHDKVGREDLNSWASIRKLGENELVRKLRMIESLMDAAMVPSDERAVWVSPAQVVELRELGIDGEYRGMVLLRTKHEGLEVPIGCARKREKKKEKKNGKQV